MSLHQIRTHPEPVDGCFGCRIGDGPRIGYCQSAAGLDATTQKAWDRELQEYRDAKAQGIAPETTRTGGIRAAVEWSNKTGIAYSDERKAVHDMGKALERLS